MFEVKKQYAEVLKKPGTSFTVYLPPDLKAQIQARQEQARADGIEVPELRDYLYAAITHPQAFSAVSPAPAKRVEGCTTVQFKLDENTAKLLEKEQAKIIQSKEGNQREYSKQHLVCEALRYCFSLDN